MKSQNTIILLAGIILVLTMVYPPANADEGDLMLSTFIGSYHFDRGDNDDDDNCEINPGLGLGYFFHDNMYLTAGVYKNSPCKAAPYALVGWETNTDRWIGIGAFGGLVGGYSSDDISTQPLIAMPYVRLGSNRSLVSARIIINPLPNDGLVGFSLNWVIGRKVKLPSLFTSE